MGFEFRQGGPAAQVKLDHFPGSPVRFAVGPQDQHQAGDQGGVHLNFNAIGAIRHQVPAAQHAFEPAKEKFNGPAIVIAQSDQFRRQFEEIGERPIKDDWAFRMSRNNP